MKNSGKRFLALGMAAAILSQTVPVSAAAVEEQAQPAKGSTVADWKFGESFKKEGTSIGDGTLVMEDQSGNGNDLTMQFYDGKKLTDSVPEETVLNNNLSFSGETMNGSSDGSMVFNGDNTTGDGVDLVTEKTAPINTEEFEDGYTIEFLYQLPDDWTESDQWMGLMARQTSYTREGDNYSFPLNSMDEPQLGSMSVAVSNCKEIQYLAAPAADNHQMSNAAWSVSMDKGDEWYHIAIVSDGDVIRTYVNGCEAFRDYESSDMDGIFADSADGRFRIGSSWYVEKKGQWGYKELDKFLQGNLQEVRISDEALSQNEWLIPDATSYAGDYGSNEAYQLQNENNYNFVLLPDTQNTVKFKRDIMDTAVDELIDTADELNVKGVIHLGDVVENNNDGAQYDTARDIFYQIPDAGIRFLVQPGNHDGWASGTTNYWNSFGESSKIFADRTSWYLTNHGYSSYMLVDAGSYTYLVISLACTGSDPGRNNNTAWDAGHEQWLKEVLAQYPDCPTIVTTHDLQNCSDTEPSAIKLSNNGQKLWNIVKDYDQVFMMVGGHSHGAGVETLNNTNGKPVISVLTDYQFAYNGGNGIFRYLEFDETQNKLFYSSYSPYAASLSAEQKSFFDVNFLNGTGNRGSVELNFAERFPGMEKENSLVATEGKWMSGEYHTHSGQSKDATENFMSLANVLGSAFRDESVLGGNTDSATKTDNLTDNTGFDFLSLADHLRKSYNGVDGNGNGNYTTPFYVAVQTQQREMEKLQAQGKYTDKLLYSATEWDMPGLDHATVGLIDSKSDAVPFVGIHEFEWKYASTKDGDDPTSMFTATGNNYSGDFDEQAVWGERLNQNNPSVDVAVDAVKWVAQNYPDSYVLPNHPSRHDNGNDTVDYGEVSIEALRKLNDAASNVVFGMEGMPGNQMDGACELPASDIRGGADQMISVTGGVWDAMLSEGRRFYNFANSDFHFKVSTSEQYASGYWASEYSANHTWVEPGADAAFNFADVVAGMRSGNSYSVNGNLISDLEFNVSDTDGSATMGQELGTEQNSEVTVTVRFKVPEKNNYESLYGTDTGIAVNNIPSVDHVDLIAGHVTGKVAEENYSSTANSDAKIVKTFTKEELEAAKGEDGSYTLSYTTKADGDLYFRLRGLSSSEVDENGDPATQERTIPEERPARFDYVNDYNYSHLSFYANPIFVKTTPTYETVVDEATENGTITVTDAYAKAGDTVSFTVKADKGYQIKQVTAKAADGTALEVQKTESEGIYQFVMPEQSVVLSAEFEQSSEDTSKKVDKTKLQAAIKAAAAIKQADYTADSYRTFGSALTKAKNVEANAKATQKEVDSALSALKAAQAKLVKKTTTEPTPSEEQQVVVKAPAVPGSVKAVSTGSTSAKISWKKVSGATGYQIYQYNGKTKKYTKITTLKSCSYTKKKLTAGTKYTFKVRAYVKKSGKTVYGKYTKSVTVKPVPQTVTSFKAKKLSKTSIRFSWKKASDVSGYSIVYSTKKNGSYRTLKTIGKASTTKYTARVKKGRTYYFKVRAYKTVKGKKVYGNYSKVVQTKMK